MKPVKVALAHDHLFQLGGAERVLSVLASLYNNTPIFTLINDRKISKKILKNHSIKTSWLQKIPGINKIFRYFLITMPKIWSKTDLNDYDLVLSSSSGFVKGLKTKGKHVCYCHSPTRYLWDDKEEYIGNMPEGKLFRLLLPRLLKNLQSWDYDKAQDIDYFLANSKYIAHKILKHYNKQSIVIYPPVKVDNFSLAEKVQDYYLIVSRLRPYKKVDLAIKAFNNLKLPLKIIGSGSEMKRLKKISNSNIEFLGEISDKERNFYLSHCKAFIYPQIEDFGITAIEAMASGRPVIAYAAGGALETIKDGISGTFFKDQTWESLAHKVLRFNSKEYNSKDIQEYSKKFDESVFKEKILNFIKEI